MEEGAKEVEGLDHSEMEHVETKEEAAATIMKV
jgi:hypothetical protein